MALSIDLRKRVIAAVDEGGHITKIAEMFKVSRRVIYKWLDLRKETNDIAPKRGYQKGHSHKIKDWVRFKEFAEKNKYNTLDEMKVKWELLTNESISRSVLWKALKKINYTSKKNIWVQRSRSEEARKIFRRN
jgi:transposase